MSNRFALLLLVSVVSASVLVTAAETKIDGPVIGIDLGILIDLSVRCISRICVHNFIVLYCFIFCVGCESCCFFIFDIYIYISFFPLSRFDACHIYYIMF